MFITRLRCEACGDFFETQEAADSHQYGEFVEAGELQEWLDDEHTVVEDDEDGQDHDFERDFRLDN